LLKANHVDAIVLEKYPAILYTKNNTNLSYKIIEVIKEGDTIAVTPNSPLLPKINEALDDLEKNGVIKMLEEKWLK
jgi:ABC-type amino acid transport substrate-binding protein